MNNEYINKTWECNECWVCGAESEEFSICSDGCFFGCSDPAYHSGNCDGSC